MDNKYNTQLKKLVLPEYGRNVQQMVDFCVALEDKEERTHCAKTIINIMGNLFPHLRDVDDYNHKLWDHLAIMSDFKLDIDYPCEIIKEENLYTKPEHVPYSTSNVRYRHYGQNIEAVIKVASEMEPSVERDALVSMIAHHMKKLYIAWNKDGVEDEKIFRDLYELSKGKINVSTSELKLREFKEPVVQNTPKKGRKKN